MPRFTLRDLADRQHGRSLAQRDHIPPIATCPDCGAVLDVDAHATVVAPSGVPARVRLAFCSCCEFALQF